MPLSESQEQVRTFLESKNFQRMWERPAYGDKLVTYVLEGPKRKESYPGIHIYEYGDDGTWDLGHGYAVKEELGIIQDIMHELISIRRYPPERRIIITTPDGDGAR